MQSTHVRTTINGQPAEFLCEPRQSLLEVLRDILRLTGTKEGCNDGNCGACTVEMDGRIVPACLVLGVEAEGATHPDRSKGIARRQRAARRAALRFSRAPPCSAASARPGSSSHRRRFWTGIPTPARDEIRLWLANNLCRCTGYDKISPLGAVGRNPNAAGAGDRIMSTTSLDPALAATRSG